MISFQAFLNDLARIHADACKGEGRRCCFVLGAGASCDSGIRLADALCDDWLRDLHREADHKEVPVEEWATSETLGIPGFSRDRRAESYGQIFVRRFGREPEHGRSWLENEMAGKHPSWGYNILVQLLATHPIVVTPNFDSLVADAIRLSGGPDPLTIPHADLAGQVPEHPRCPVILKLHRDLPCTANVADDDISSLPGAWHALLERIFREYIPIFIGYGGHDGSLMGFLSKLPSDVPRRAYWLEMEGATINDEVRRFLEPEFRFLVRHDGFDVTMRRIQEGLSLDDPRKMLAGTQDERIGLLAKQEETLNSRFAALAAALRESRGLLSDEFLTAEAEGIIFLVDQQRYADAEVRLRNIEKALVCCLDQTESRGRLLIAYARGRLLQGVCSGFLARDCYETLIARCRSFLGEDDPLLVRCIGSLASVLTSPHCRFPTPLWTPGVPSHEEPEALEQLCMMYGESICKFIRSRLRDEDKPCAEDLTRTFLLNFLSRETTRMTDRAGGRFRTLITASVENFLRNWYRNGISISSGERLVPVRLDENVKRDKEPGLCADDEASGDKIAGTELALSLHFQTLEQIRLTWMGQKQQVPLETLTPFLDVPGDAAAYSKVAQKYGLSVDQVKRRVYQMREMYTGCVKSLVSRMVAPPDLDEEFSRLMALRVQAIRAGSESEHRAVVAEMERVLGPEHPDTLTSRFNLAISLRDLQKWPEAVAEAERARDGRRKVLGESHPDTKVAAWLVEQIRGKQAAAEGEAGE